MNQTRKVAFVVLSTLLLLGAGVALWLHATDVGRPAIPSASAGSKTVTATDTPAIDGTGAMPADAAHRAGMDLAILKLLSSDRRDRWMEGAGELSRLPSDEQWRILASPGIAGQPEAKAIREEILYACAVTLGKPPVGDEVGNDDATAVDQWCSHLEEIGTPDEFMAWARELAADGDYQSAGFRLWWYDRAGMTDAQLSGKVEELRVSVSTAGSPAEIKAAVRGLWLLGDKAYARQWPQVEALSRFQRSRLEDAVAASVASRIAGAGGPNDSATMYFCATMPGVSCAPGQGLDAVLRGNLSEAEYLLLQQITAATLESRQG